MSMIAKRLLDSKGDDPEQPKQKTTKTALSFESVLREVVKMELLNRLVSILDPLIRKAVKEEIENAVFRNKFPILRSLSLQLRAPESSTSSLELCFNKNLALPIFTGNKIKAEKNSQLQILLMETHEGNKVQTSVPFPIKIVIVVINGDFPEKTEASWTSEYFEKNIVKERTGRKPLLCGGYNLILKDGVAPLDDISITDNSSWSRSGCFRLGAKVVLDSSNGMIIKEGMTESFQVKDRRGESYKKHHPPRLQDDVWRLEKIAKEGVFHKRLIKEGIRTVQDFLQLWNVDAPKLRNILQNMSENMLEGTIKHAETCDLGSDHFLYEVRDLHVYLNPICQVVKAECRGQNISLAIYKELLEKLAREAHCQWNSLKLIPKDPSFSLQNEMMGQEDEEYGGNSNLIGFDENYELYIDPNLGVPQFQTNLTGEESNYWG